jgi:hypothetical protein
MKALVMMITNYFLNENRYHLIDGDFSAWMCTDSAGEAGLPQIQLQSAAIRCLE